MEQESFEGKEVISPDKISNYEYDKIVIMSSYIVEITEQLISLGVNGDRIVYGMNLLPRTFKELSYISEKNVIYADCDGKIYYFLNDEKRIPILKSDDLNNLKEYRCGNLKYAAQIKNLCPEPISRVFAYDRGISVGRYYINEFIQENKRYIQGRAIEIGDRNYTEQYGNSRESYVLNAEMSSDGDPFEIQGDLETGKNIPKEAFDCFICTQTLNFIYDFQNAARNIIAALKPGGTALITVSGISQISGHDRDCWGHYWQFTDMSLRRLFAGHEDVAEVSVTTYGNVKSSTAFLYGLSASEIENDLADNDPDYQLIAAAVVHKKRKV